MLDKAVSLCYSMQARPNESEGASEANLENDTEKKRAIQEEDSEDSKE